jgi:hypothetical protein
LPEHVRLFVDRVMETCGYFTTISWLLVRPFTL